MTEEFDLVERALTVEEYHRMHEAVGWGRLDAEATATGLRSSLYSVCLEHRDEVIACGRVVGDGGLFFYIQDVIVLPEFQGRGFGRRIMDAIMAYLAASAHTGAFVGLMAAKGVEDFYTPFGFVARPSERFGPGMGRLI